MGARLAELLPRILPQGWQLNKNVFIRTHDGKSDLQRSIPIKVRAFGSIPGMNVGIIIVEDQDSWNCVELKQHLLKLYTEQAKPNIKCMVRIVCHELEAWYLGDMQAIQHVFPRFKPEQHKNKAKFRNPDACINPKRELKSIVGEYPQIQTAKQIAKHFDIEANKSTSFNYFISGLLRFLED